MEADPCCKIIRLLLASFGMCSANTELAHSALSVAFEGVRPPDGPRAAKSGGTHRNASAFSVKKKNVDLVGATSCHVSDVSGPVHTWY